MVKTQGKHTPGPWARIGGRIKAVIDGTEVTIAAARAYIHPVSPGVLGPNTKAAAANARLMTLAPEMLDALHEAEAGLWFAGADQEIPPGDFVPSPTLALRNVRAVLAKVSDPSA